MYIEREVERTVDRMLGQGKVVLVTVCPLCFWKRFAAHGFIPMGTVKYKSGT